MKQTKSMWKPKQKKAEAVHKEDSSDETETDDGYGETKELDLTAVANATAEKEAVLKEDSAEETKTDYWSSESKDVDFMAFSKATAQTEAVHKENSAEDTEKQLVGLVKQRKLI